MGEKLMQFYEKSNALGGIKAKMRLAVLTLMPGSKAQVEPDSPETIALFEKAMAEINKEFK